MNKKITLSTKQEKQRILLLIIGLSSLFIISTILLNLELVTFFQRFASAGEVITKFLTLDFTDFGSILAELFTSICMAIAGLTIGILLSIPLSFLGAANTTPVPILGAFIKGTVAIIRGVPALVWILIVVASLGFGNTSGVIGLVFPTLGYLTKSFISSIEEQDETIIETMNALGADWLQLIIEGLVPGLVNPFLSWISIRLEGNIAESISLGMVGAGGIGMLLTKAIGQYNYGKISTIILTIFVTMVTVELLVGRIKKTIR